MLREPIVDLAATEPGSPVVNKRPLPNAKFLALPLLLLVLCFSKPLFQLANFALNSQLYSHILLIPFIAGYLVWLKRGHFTTNPAPALSLAFVPLVIALTLLAFYWGRFHLGWVFAREDYLAIMTISFVLFLVSCCLVVLGRENVRLLAFPITFLFWMAPFPVAVRNAIEAFLQHGSADAAYLFFKASGMPVLRHNTHFQLPGFSMEVAPQCSGIHSSIVLFISALLAGHLLLRLRWTRAVLVLTVIPLALLRNGFRIFTLGQLCVQLDPGYIESDLHRRGGPIFFVLSLIPFFLLLFVLRKLERRKLRRPS